MGETYSDPADLSPDDKNGPPAGDAGDTETVPSEQDPVAAGVDEDRAEKWALYDTVSRSYVHGTVRNRPLTAKMRSDLERLNAEAGSERFVVHRV